MGRGRGGGGRTYQHFYVDDFPKINTHSGDYALSNSIKLCPGEVEGEAGRGRAGQNWNEI